MSACRFPSVCVCDTVCGKLFVTTHTTVTAVRYPSIFDIKVTFGFYCNFLLCTLSAEKTTRRHGVVVVLFGRGGRHSVG